MAIPAAVAEWNGYTNKMIVPAMADTFSKHDPLIIRLLNKKQAFPGGRALDHPFMYQKLTGGAYTKGATFNIDYVNTEAALSNVLKNYEVNLTLYAEDDIYNRGNAAVFAQIETKSATASISLMEYIIGDMYKDGQTSSGDVTTSGGKLSTSASIDGLLAWVDDGNSGGSYTTATDYTKAFSTVGGITRSDVGTVPSSGTASTAANVGGLNAYTDRSASTFSLSLFNEAMGMASVGSQVPDLIVVNQATWNKFWNFVTPNQKFYSTDSDLAKVGFKAFNFNGADVVVSKYLPSGLAFGLNTDHVKLYISSNPKYAFGFTGFKEAQNSTVLAGQFLVALNLVIPQPRFSFKLVGSAL